MTSKAGTTIKASQLSSSASAVGVAGILGGTTPGPGTGVLGGSVVTYN